MHLGFSKEDLAFRDEVRNFLDKELTEEFREAGRRATSVFTDSKEICLGWHKTLYRKGWVAPNWPVEYGGTGWSEVQKYIFSSECARADAPSLSPMGLRMCGPMLIGMGTQEQKDTYLPRILAGEDFWCQGYSEPGSGSDLASLQCKAVSDGDDYIINGTKIWTSQAHFANMMFCLVRTNSDGKPQQGITFLLIDMSTPGITVDPIISISGDHEFNQVFFDNVRVPKKNRVGEEDKGWTVAKYLLEFERGGAYSAALKANVGKLKRFAQQQNSGNGNDLADDLDFKTRLETISVELDAVEMTENRIMSALSNGQNPGPASSQLKIRGTEMKQKIDELSVYAASYYAQVDQKGSRSIGANGEIIGPKAAMTFMPSYLNNRAATIYGGSSEVQRGILAKLVLGL